MANDVVFNIAKGQVAYYASLPAANDGLVLLLLKSTGLVSDATMIDYDDVAAILAGASDEADATNYVRKALTGVTVTVDDTNDRVALDAGNVTYTALGGGTNNTLGAAVIAYDPDTTGGTDSSLIPLSKHGVTATTDGTDLTLTITDFIRAS